MAVRVHRFCRQPHRIPERHQRIGRGRDDHRARLLSDRHSRRPRHRARRCGDPRLPVSHSRHETYAVHYDDQRVARHPCERHPRHRMAVRVHRLRRQPHGVPECLQDGCLPRHAHLRHFLIHSHLGNRRLRRGCCRHPCASVHRRRRQPLSVHGNDRLVIRRPHELRARHDMPVPIPRLRRKPNRITDSDQRMCSRGHGQFGNRLFHCHLRAGRRRPGRGGHGRAAVAHCGNEPFRHGGDGRIAAVPRDSDIGHLLAVLVAHRSDHS